MQSIENRIRTELIHSALTVALEELKKNKLGNEPHGAVSLLTRAIKLRKTELILSFDGGV